MRQAKIAAGSGASMPMSVSNIPVSTSRIHDAPVAAATARDAYGSHRTLTPNGTERSRCVAVTTAAMYAGISGPTLVAYGRSASLQYMTPSMPPAWSPSMSRRTPSTTAANGAPM